MKLKPNRKVSEGSKTLSGAREVLLQGSFYEVSLALVGVASLAVLPILGYDFVERKLFLYENPNFFHTPLLQDRIDPDIKVENCR